MSATLDYRKHKGRRRGTSAPRRSSAPALDSGSRFRGRFGKRRPEPWPSRGALARLWIKPFAWLLPLAFDGPELTASAAAEANLRDVG